MLSTHDAEDRRDDKRLARIAGEARNSLERSKEALDQLLARTGPEGGAEEGGAAPRRAAEARDAVLGVLSRASKRVQPWLAREWRQLRARVHPQSLLRDYRRFLLGIHTRIFDRPVEQLCFVPTRDQAKLVDLRIPSLLRATGHDYKPTPRLVFEWAMSALPAGLKGWTFVDVGAGRGRVLLLASNRQFEKVRGIEFAQELHNDCEMNIAQYPRSLMRCRDVECVHGAATDMAFGEQDTVFYFFNPFEPGIFAEIVRKLVASYAAHPRRIYLVCVDMDAGGIVESSNAFIPAPIPPLQRLKIALFSPYRIAVYRTVA